MKKNMITLVICFCLLCTGRLYAQEVNLYAANSEDSIQIVLDAVREQAPDLKVNVVRAKTGALLQRIVAEKAHPGGDVFWSSGFGTLAGYTQVADSYASKQEAHVPSSLHGPDHRWLGTNVHVVVLMVNKKQLKGRMPGAGKTCSRAPIQTAWPLRIPQPPVRPICSFTAFTKNTVKTAWADLPSGSP